MCVIVSTNFSRLCGWLRFSAQPKLLFFYSGHPDVCTAMIIVNTIRGKERVPTYRPFSTGKIFLDLLPDCTPQGD